MSDPDKDRSNCVDDEENGGRKSDRKKRSRRGKRVSLFRFRKVHRRNKLPSSSTNSCCFLGKRGMIGGCFKETAIVDSPGSQESDPNCYTYESLRGLIEKNDFFAKECNTHLDLDTVAASNRHIPEVKDFSRNCVEKFQKIARIPSKSDVLSMCRLFRTSILKRPNVV